MSRRDSPHNDGCSGGGAANGLGDVPVDVGNDLSGFSPSGDEGLPRLLGFFSRFLLFGRLLLLLGGFLLFLGGFFFLVVLLLFFLFFLFFLGGFFLILWEVVLAFVCAPLDGLEITFEVFKASSTDCVCLIRRITNGQVPIRLLVFCGTQVAVVATG